MVVDLVLRAASPAEELIESSMAGSAAEDEGNALEPGPEWSACVFCCALREDARVRLPELVFELSRLSSSS